MSEVNKKLFHYISRTCVGVLTAAAVLAAVPAAKAAAETVYLSSVETAPGENGESALIDKGFQALHPMLNGKNGEPFWLGYQTTSDASAAITELQANADGSFTWKTGTGKAPVLSLYFVSANSTGEADFNNIMPLLNNGATVMPGADGNPAVFSTDNGQGYLAVIRQDVWKTYVANVTAATAATKKEALTQLYRSGCEYYIDKNLSKDKEKAAYLGYTRTGDASKAITDLVALPSGQAAPEGYEAVADTADGRKIFITHSAAMGNPVVDLEPIASESAAELGAKELAVMIAANGDNSVTKPYILQNADYQAFAQSGKRYVMSDCAPIGGSAGLSCAAAKDGFAEKRQARNTLLGVSTEGENADSLTKLGGTEETTAAQAEPVAPEKHEEEETEEATVSADAATAYSSPGDEMPPIPAIVIPLVIAAAIPVAVIFLRRKILQSGGGGNEKK